MDQQSPHKKDLESWWKPDWKSFFSALLGTGSGLLAFFLFTQQPTQPPPPAKTPECRRGASLPAEGAARTPYAPAKIPINFSEPAPTEAELASLAPIQCKLTLLPEDPPKSKIKFREPNWTLFAAEFEAFCEEYGKEFRYAMATGEPEKFLSLADDLSTFPAKAVFIRDNFKSKSKDPVVKAVQKATSEVQFNIFARQALDKLPAQIQKHRDYVTKARTSFLEKIISGRKPSSFKQR